MYWDWRVLNKHANENFKKRQGKFNEEVKTTKNIPDGGEDG